MPRKKPKLQALATITLPPEPKSALEILGTLSAKIAKRQHGIVEAEPNKPVWEIDEPTGMALARLFAKVRQENGEIESCHLREAQAAYRQGALFITIKKMVPVGWWTQFVEDVLSKQVKLAPRTIRERLKFVELMDANAMKMAGRVWGYHEACVELGLKKPTQITAKYADEINGGASEPPPPPIIEPRYDLSHIKHAIAGLPNYVHRRDVKILLNGTYVPIRPVELRQMADDLEWEERYMDHRQMQFEFSL